MLTIFDSKDALSIDDAHLRSLVLGHLETAKEGGLEKLTCIAVVEAEDTEEQFVAALGFSPLENPLSETRHGEPDFLPSWDWLEIHSQWFELIYTVGDDGFAYLIFTSRRNGPDWLATLCLSGGRGTAT